jgi:hypothetical protein
VQSVEVACGAAHCRTAAVIGEQRSQALDERIGIGDPQRCACVDCSGAGLGEIEGVGS